MRPEDIQFAEVKDSEFATQKIQNSLRRNAFCPKNLIPTSEDEANKMHEMEKSQAS
uniref:Uncharacterized protein n=1 Tax=Arundo donax TaxID=35708 RepID=A0A0A8Z6S4_ARUDO